MLTLSNLAPNPGSKKDRKRIGRGQGSGHGGTATKGHKGAKARSGGGVKVGFEGGQMPLQRRVPKRGFKSVFKKEYALVNLRDLDGFAPGTRIDRPALIAKGIVAARASLIKILANGEISHPVIVAVDKVSAVAMEKIKAAGGTVEGL